MIIMNPENAGPKPGEDALEYQLRITRENMKEILSPDEYAEFLRSIEATDNVESAEE
jgi:hypothetical protein